jgi:hypothetical protein
MSDELLRKLKAIHDLDRAIHVWEEVRDKAQQAISEMTVCSEKQVDSFETNLILAKARACLNACNSSILGARARIDELERGKWPS